MNNKPVYLIGDILVKNNEEYKKYVELVTPVAEKYGGEYLIRGGNVDLATMGLIVGFIVMMSLDVALG